MIDVKCKGCNKLLAKAESMNAAIKCPRCKMIFEYHVYTNLFMSNSDDPNTLLRNKKDNANIKQETSESTH